MNQDAFLDELVSLVQNQDRLLKVFRMLLDMNGIELGPNFKQRYVDLARRLREAQENVKRGLGG